MATEQDFQLALEQQRVRKAKQAADLESALEQQRIRKELAEDDQRGHIADTAAGAARIIPFIAEETLDLFASISEATIIPGVENAILFFKDTVGRRGDDPRTAEIEDADHTFSLTKEELEQFPRKSTLRTVESGVAAVKDFIPEPERVSGQVVETIGRFVGGFVGAGKIKWLAKLKGKGSWGRWASTAMRGELAALAVFDGHEERASNFAKDMGVENQFVDWLAADDEDGELEGRLKNAVEGTIFGVAIDSIMTGFRALKVGKKFREARTRYQDNRQATKELEARIEENGKIDIDAEDFRETADDFGFTNEPDGFVQTIDYDPQTSRFRVDTEDGLNVVSKNDDSLDALMPLRETDDTVSVVFAGIEEGARGKGIGLDMYVEAVEYALARGKVFASDETVSRSARKIYKKLEERGYVIERNQNVTEVGNSSGAPISTTDGSPLFKISGKTTAPVARAADDVATVASRTVGRASTPEQLVAAIQRSSDEGIGRLDIDYSSFADDPIALTKFMRSLEQGYAHVLKTTDKVTNAATLAKAQKQLGERFGDSTVEDLYKGLTEGHGTSAKQVAADQLVINSEKKLIELAVRATRTSATQPQKVAFLRQLQIHGAVDAHIRGARAEIARSLQAMSILKPGRLLEGFDLAELAGQAGVHKSVDDLAKKVIQNKNDPDLLQKLTKRGFGSKLRDVLQEIFYGNILSAPSTQIANIMGNTWKVAEDIMLRGGGLMVAGVKGVMTRQGIPKERWFEVIGYVAGLKQFGEETFRISLKAIRQNAHEAGFSLTKMSKLERKVFYQEQDELGNLWKALLTGDSQTGRASKLAEAGQSGLAINYVQPDNLKDLSGWMRAYHRGIGLMVNTVGATVRLPGKGIVGMDEIFKSLANNTEKYSRAYSDAYVALRTTPSPRSVGDMAAELLSSGDYDQVGIDFARSQTFQQELGQFGKWVEAGLNKFPSGRFIVPFVRTPTNLLKDGLSYTPLQLVNKNMWADVAAGGIRQERAIAKLGLMMGFTAYVSSMWHEGKLKGAGSRTNSEALRGVLSYSAQDGDGTWHRFNRLDPIGMMIGFTADVMDAYAEFDEAGQEDLAEELTQAASAIGMAFAQNFASKTYLRGVSEFVGVIDQWQRGSTTKASDFAGTLLANLLPIAGSNFERRRASGQDFFGRYVFTVLDELRARIPEEGFSVGGVIADVIGLEGDRSDLGIRRNALGRPIKNTLTMTSVMSESQESNRELDLQLADLDFNIPMGGRSIAGIQLSSKQYSEWLLIRGQQVQDLGMTLEQELLLEFDDPFFNALPTIGQQESISAIVRRFSVLAREELLRRDSDLAEKVRLAREEKDAERRPQRSAPAQPVEPTAETPEEMVARLFSGG